MVIQMYRYFESGILVEILIVDVHPAQGCRNTKAQKEAAAVANFRQTHS